MIIPSETSRKLLELARTIELWRSTPFDWDEGNCLMAPGAHVNRVHPRLDCGAAWRGRIGGEEQALAILEQGGGSLVIFGGEMERLGIEPTETPEAGDVVIAEFENGYIGGVKTERGACFRTVHGVADIRDRWMPKMHGWRL